MVSTPTKASSTDTLMQQVCALCRCEADLQKSHYLPSFIFQAITEADSAENTSVIHVDTPKQKTYSTDRQLKKPLLCSDCENLFSKYGETTVGGHCYKGEGQFELRSQLMDMTPNVLPDGKALYHGEEAISLLTAQNYVYFALSMVWRGSVGNWPPPYDGLKNALGDKYSELFRQYLLSPDKMPEKTAVIVRVDCDTPSQMSLSTSPVGSGGRTVVAGTRVYNFMIPGIFFSVLVGGNIEKMLPSRAIGDRVIFKKWSFVNSPQRQDMVDTTQSSTLKGKLASQFPDPVK